MNFFSNDNKNLSSELEVSFNALNCVDVKDQLQAKYIIQQVQTYIEDTMLPEVLKLQMILLINAFNLKSKLICDLFYSFDTMSKERKMRDSKDFYTLVAGRFMVSYYKVG